MAEPKVFKQGELPPPVKELTLGVSRTFNLGNYESCRVEATVTASLESWRTMEAATEKLLPHIRRALKLAYDDHIDAKERGRDL